MTVMNKLTRAAVPVLALAASCFALPTTAKADANPFIGEIAAMGIFGFCPRGWAETNGALLPIAQNSALFSLLGTTFGGDGRTTFGLPDLRGRTPVGVGTGAGLSSVAWGQRGGAEYVVLTESQLPSHNHVVNANNLDGDKPGPGSKLLAAAPPSGTGTETIYSDQAATVQMSSQMIANSGGGQSVPIIDATAVIRYCIALQGVFPSRS